MARAGERAEALANVMKALILLLVIGGALYAFCRETSFDPALDARLELAHTRDQLAETQKQLEATRSQIAEGTKTEKKRLSWLEQRLEEMGNPLAGPDSDPAHGGRRR